VRHSEVVSERRDIETREDCERLVRAFYGRTLTDPMIGWIFTDVAKLDLEEHVPTITSFWATMLLDEERTYYGGAFAPHASLHRKVDLKAAHFERWLLLWRTTVDELFAGEHAELAKAHATRVGAAFHRRLQTLPGDDAADLGFVPADEVGADGLTLGLAVTQHGPAAGQPQR
jgi:hemoglobin